MYTRSRQSQGYGNPRPQTNNAGGAAPYQPTTYSQQGNYQSQVPPQNQQQGPFKPAGVQNAQQARTLPTPQVAKPPTIQQSQIKPALQAQQVQPTSTPPQPQRLKPILKQSPANIVAASTPPVVIPPQPVVTSAPATTAPVVTAAEVKNDPGDESMDTGSQEQPKWKRAKTPGYKVNRKLKRLRMNQRLRRTLQPKNAIMVLNEMKTGVQFTFPETQAAMPNSLFVVHAEIDNKTYVGQGLSKPLARQNAAENALKCLLLEKMTAAAMKARIDAESDGQSGQIDSSQIVPKEENNEAAAASAAAAAAVTAETNAEEQDEIPWSSLASFALYKLFVEWQNQGTVVPVPRPGVSPGKSKKEPKPPVQKDLPANAINIHPVMLLNQMRPGLTYVEVNRIGNPPNTMFTLGVEIDGVEYTGAAKNKKDAKKMAAKSALTTLYGLTYPEEEKMDHTEDIPMC